MSVTLATDVLLLVLAGLLAWAAYWDVRTFNISNELNLTIALLAPLYWWASGTPLWPDAAMQAAIAVAVFVVLAGAFYLGMMGGGDVKMAAAVLLWLPAARALDFLMIMALAGGAVTVFALVRHRVKQRPEHPDARPEVPYGVAISTAGLWLIAERYLYHFS